MVFNYMLPFQVRSKDVAFWQAHARFEDLFKILSGSWRPQMQCLTGGGYRWRVRKDLMIGGTCFYNAIRLNGTWYTSEIYGFEMAAVTSRDAVLTLGVNYYGNVFLGTGGIFNGFKDDPGDYRLQGTYSQPLRLYNRPFDIRLKLSGYVLNRTKPVTGWNVGGDLTTPDGLVNLRYEIGGDAINLRYHIMGLTVTVGFTVESLARGENPFGLRNSR